MYFPQASETNNHDFLCKKGVVARELRRVTHYFFYFFHNKLLILVHLQQAKIQLVEMAFLSKTRCDQNLEFYIYRIS